MGDLLLTASHQKNSKGVSQIEGEDFKSLQSLL